MSQFRILDFNYLFENAAQVYATSSDGSFPVANLQHILRSKVWRSSGYFEITSSNNKIDFKDDASGSELTVTVPAGNYNTTDLALVIGTQMSNASLPSQADTYTCSYSASTGRWTISSDGSYLSILWSTGTNTANTIGDVLGFDATSDSTSATSYTGPEVAIHTSERVTVDLGNTQAIDSFAMLFHPFVGSKFTDQATVKLQANAHNEWSSPSVDQTLSYDDRYNLYTHFFTSDQSYRYWSVEIVDPTNPNLYVEVPTLCLAKATQLTQVPNAGFSENRADLSTRSVTPYGQAYTDLNPTRRRLTFAYSTLSESDLETLLDVYDRVGTGVPICVALDPTATVFDKDRYFIYGTIIDAFQSEHVFYDLFNSGFTVEETL